MKHHNVYAIAFSVLWRFTRRNWIRLLNEYALGRSPEFSEYGTYVAPVVHEIGSMDTDEAKELLAIEKKRIERSESRK